MNNSELRIQNTVKSFFPTVETFLKSKLNMVQKINLVFSMTNFDSFFDKFLNLITFGWHHKHSKELIRSALDAIVPKNKIFISTDASGLNLREAK